MDKPRPLVPRGCAIAAAIAFLLLAIAFGLARQASSWWVRRNMSPAELASFDRLKNRIVHFPPEWTSQFGRPPEAVFDAVRRLESAEAPIESFLRGLGPLDTSHPLHLAMRHYVAGTPLPSDLETTVVAAVKRWEIVAAEIDAATSTPGFICDARLLVLSEYARPYSFFIFKLSECASHYYADHAMWAPASRAQLLTLKRFAHRELSSWETHSASEQAVLSECSLIARLMDRCPDALLLERLLAELNAWRSRLVSEFHESPRAAYRVSTLVRMQWDGYPAPCPDLQPERYYVTRVGHEFVPYLRYVLANVPPTSADYHAIRKFSGLPEQLRRQQALRRIRDAFAPDLALADLWMDEEDETGFRIAAAIYDLLRLRIARRIATLRGTNVPDSVEEAVPRYLQEAPKDPFSTGTLRYDAKSEQFYSIGPDKRDDELRKVMDPSEEYSPGDLTVPSGEEWTEMYDPDII